MCGIVGYIGKNDGTQFVMNGLAALEYRGYDSAGIAVVDGEKSELVKQVGRVESLQAAVNEAAPKGRLAIGHTRWATHGAPTLLNAHPHVNTAGTIFVVHNGIIENHEELRAKLQEADYVFTTETDTEVVPQLIDYYYHRLDSFEAAVRAALEDLQGAYAIAVVSTLDPDTVYAARVSSPLVIGVGDGEYYLASDPAALTKHTKKVIFLDDYDFALIKAGGVKVHDLKRGGRVEREVELLDYDGEQALMGDYPHFMLKEIFEGPQTVRSAMLGRALPEKGIVKLGGLESVDEQLKYIDRIVIVACGTSYYAGLVGEYLIEELAGIPVEVQFSSEFKYRNEPFSRSTALLAISQSGETADTIAALNKVADYGVLRLGIVNAVGSTIARITDAGVYCHAGPEQAVASTKAFLAQVTVLALMALHLSGGKTRHFKPLLEELDTLPGKIQTVLDQAETIKILAEKYQHARDFMFVGRHYSFPPALEGALKLKEISYIHAEGYAAGELKHGPLALIDKDFPTVALATDSPLLEKTLSNMQEIKARSGPILAVATEGNQSVSKLADDIVYVPKTLDQLQPLLQVVVLQLFAYYMAVARGHDVDRPRNLAKSVTVE